MQREAVEAHDRRGRLRRAGRVERADLTIEVVEVGDQLGQGQRDGRSAGPSSRALMSWRRAWPSRRARLSRTTIDPSTCQCWLSTGQAAVQRVVAADVARGALRSLGQA